ncbi:MAG: transposase [Saprospiraceae bacterium]
MPNHIHVMYEVLEPYTNEKIKHSFLSYTAHEFSALMSLENKKPFIVNKSNRNIQYWKSSSLSVEIFSPKFFSQKMNYIHNNPLKAGLVSDNKDYTYCSYRSYEEGKPIFDFLTLF